MVTMVSFWSCWHCGLMIIMVSFGSYLHCGQCVCQSRQCSAYSPQQREDYFLQAVQVCDRPGLTKCVPDNFYNFLGRYEDVEGNFPISTFVLIYKIINYHTTLINIGLTA